ncbi:hypothetical protein EJB05_52241, partial [Eragrostis curvula]
MKRGGVAAQGCWGGRASVVAQRVCARRRRGEHDESPDACSIFGSPVCLLVVGVKKKLPLLFTVHERQWSICLSNLPNLLYLLALSAHRVGLRVPGREGSPSPCRVGRRKAIEESDPLRRMRLSSPASFHPLRCLIQPRPDQSLDKNGLHPFMVSNTKDMMDPMEDTSAAKLTDDLVVDILSRLPYKSFFRFKCVCKTWLSFSSNPHYCQKLPKVPTGFFYQDRSSNAIKLVSLSKKNEDIDGTLSFLPDYEQLKLVDCCNGLMLCEYRSCQTCPDIFRFIVCNPATREWRTLPDAQRKPDMFHYTVKLGFDPTISPHFCVFNFRYDRGPSNLVFGLNQVEMFSSRNATWHVYQNMLDPKIHLVSVSGRPHVFLDGYLHAHTDLDVWVLEELETAQIGRPPSNWTIKLPFHSVDCVVDHCFRGCLGQYRGTLYYAVAEEDGRTVLVWSHDYYNPEGWTVEHRLSMSDAFGRDDFVHYADDFFWACNYEIIAIDMEREVLFLTDDKTERLLSYSISTGKFTEIKDSTHCFFYYVVCCLKLPAPEPDIYDDEDMI